MLVALIFVLSETSLQLQVMIKFFLVSITVTVALTTGVGKDWYQKDP